MAQSSLYYLAASAAVLAFAASHVAKIEPPPPSPIKASPAAPPSPARSGDTQGISFPRAADNHFYADARVNGTILRFLIDTGSTSVVLTASDALRAGVGGGNYSAKAMTAGGPIELMPVSLTHVTMGSVSRDHVPAMVAKGDDLPVSLLGQSFLSAFKIEIDGDTMRLR